MSEISKCKGCGKNIKWIIMSSESRMPVNIKPVKMIQIKDGIGELIDVYTPHWATCPNADSFKKNPTCKN